VAPAGGQPGYRLAHFAVADKKNFHEEKRSKELFDP
jgi:hypothetical protein